MIDARIVAPKEALVMNSLIHPLLLAALTAVAACSSSTAARRPEPPPVAPPPAAAETVPTEAAPPAPADEHAGHTPATGGQSEGAQPTGSQDLLAEEQRAYEAARPVFERYCTQCHTSRGSKSRRSTLRHLNMDSYPFGGHHAHEMGTTIREVLGTTGERATMPKDNPGAVRGDELSLVLAWTQAFDRSHAAGLHQHGEQGHGDGHQHKH